MPSSGKSASTASSSCARRARSQGLRGVRLRFRDLDARYAHRDPRKAMAINIVEHAQAFACEWLCRRRARQLGRFDEFSWKPAPITRPSMADEKTRARCKWCARGDGSRRDREGRHWPRWRSPLRPPSRECVRSGPRIASTPTSVERTLPSTNAKKPKSLLFNRPTSA